MEGPSEGNLLDTTKLKRDATAIVDKFGHLPWELAHPTLDGAAESDDPIVVVSRVSIIRALREIERLKRDVKIQHRALLHLDGSAMAVMRAKDEIIAEENR